MTYVQPLANGIRTDHPVPGLPFVEDEHIPIEDPDAVEAIGRHEGAGTWGRCDTDRGTGEWAAFTTEPKNPSVAWVIRFHPEHGRSVLLYRDSDATTAYSEWFGEKPLLSRIGGYWWNGTTWYRPSQIIDWASERYVRREVHLPTVITAADLLDGTGRAELGRPARIMQLGGEQNPLELAGYQLRAAAAQSQLAQAEQWRHDLALWTSRRGDGSLPLARCVVTVNAPELLDAVLLGVEEFATKAEIAASTLRAYIARGEADIPVPQATDGPRKRWATPVVDDWIEQRRRDPGKVAALLQPSDGDGEDGENTLAPGLRTLWNRLTEVFTAELWRDAPTRRRWSRPYRNERAATNLSSQLGWVAALHLDSTVPFEALTAVLEDAVMWQMANCAKDERRVYFDPQTGRMLGWFIEHRPSRVTNLFGAIIGRAERNGVSREVTTRSLRAAIHMDGGFDEKKLDQLDAFLDLVSPPRGEAQVSGTGGVR